MIYNFQFYMIFILVINKVVNILMKVYYQIQHVLFNIVITVNYNGWIMDGWHRVCKATIQKKKTIKAVRFKTEPIPDFYK